MALQHIPFYGGLLGQPLTDKINATHSHVLVYGAIEAHSFGPGGRCTASNETIAAETGLKASSVATIVSTLAKAGWVNVELTDKNTRTAIDPLMDIKPPLMGIKPRSSVELQSPLNISNNKETVDGTGAIAPGSDSSISFDGKLKPSAGQDTPPKSEIGFTHELEQLCAALGVPKTRVTAGRVTKLKQRRKTYTFEEMLTAATVIGKDDYMVQGKYNNIDYLVRNDEKVDMWLQRAAPKASAAAYTGPTSAPKKVWGDENVSQ